MQDRHWRPEHDEASDDATRAADADRDEIAESLRKHHAAGRLTDDEFQQRLEQCGSAKTLGELRALLADLPSDKPKRERSYSYRPRFGALLLPVLIVLAVIFSGPWRHAAWHGHGVHFGFPWPLLFLVFAGFMLLRGRARCGAHYYRRTRYM
jgi:hypothetical protein